MASNLVLAKRYQSLVWRELEDGVRPAGRTVESERVDLNTKAIEQAAC